MFSVETVKTRTFADWLDGLRDTRARTRINIKIARLEAGNFSDAKTVGGQVSELRIDYGPGYRVYFTVRRQTVVILLCGSDKDDQERTIKLAKSMAAQL